MVAKDYVLVAVPMLLPAWYLVELLNQNPLSVIGGWIQQAIRVILKQTALEEQPKIPPVASQLLAYVTVALAGFAITNRLIPNIKVRQA